jgi:two-component system response regulator (stage 0 sporulation protein F)
MITPRRCTVLVVEDQPPQRALLCDALRIAGYNVAEAWNGEQAIEALDGLLRPDQDLCLVLLDMKLPYLDGLDVLRHLATIGAYIPVVALSAHDEMLAAATSHGARTALAKPFDLDDVLAAVARYCPPPAG